VRGYDGTVTAKRYAPASVARVENLYPVPDVSVDVKQNVETLIMQRIDSDLVEPLALLTDMTIPEEFLARLKWSKFVSSLNFRGPEVVEAFDTNFKTHWLRVRRRRLRSVVSPNPHAKCPSRQSGAFSSLSIRGVPFTSPSTFLH